MSLIVPCGESIDFKIQYGIVYNYLYPWVRSFVLREVLEEHKSFTEMTSIPQAENERLTYHFMYKNIQ